MNITSMNITIYLMVPFRMIVFLIVFCPLIAVFSSSCDELDNKSIEIKGIYGSPKPTGKRV